MPADIGQEALDQYVDNVLNCQASRAILYQRAGASITDGE